MTKLVIEVYDEVLEGIVFKNKNKISLKPSELAILHGTPLPKNPTNGDMIKALFPSIEIADCPKFNEVYTGIPFGELIGANIDCMRDWWNAPYKRGEEDADSD